MSFKMPKAKPAWRRSLDIYKAWNEKNVPYSKVAECFSVDERTARHAVAEIGDLLYPRGVRGSSISFEELEAIFVTVARYSEQEDVTRLSKIIRKTFGTMAGLYGYTGDFQTIKGIGPKYTDVLEHIRNQDAPKEIHIRSSFKTYLRLQAYAKIHKKTLSWAVERAAEKLPL